MDEDETCPVCGFELGFVPWIGESPSDEICPSCLIQFGYDDAAGSDPVERTAIYLRWREQWIAAGMPWKSRGRKPPIDWNPVRQLKRVQDEPL